MRFAITRNGELLMGPMPAVAIPSVGEWINITGNEDCTEEFLSSSHMVRGRGWGFNSTDNTLTVILHVTP